MAGMLLPSVSLGFSPVSSISPSVFNFLHIQQQNSQVKFIPPESQGKVVKRHRQGQAGMGVQEEERQCAGWQGVGSWAGRWWQAWQGEGRQQVPKAGKAGKQGIVRARGRAKCKMWPSM